MGEVTCLQACQQPWADARLHKIDTEGHRQEAWCAPCNSSSSKSPPFSSHVLLCSRRAETSSGRGTPGVGRPLPPDDTAASRWALSGCDAANCCAGPSEPAEPNPTPSMPAEAAASAPSMPASRPPSCPPGSAVLCWSAVSDAASPAGCGAGSGSLGSCKAAAGDVESSGLTVAFWAHATVAGHELLEGSDNARSRICCRRCTEC